MAKPKGKNDLGSYAIFTQRKLYKEEAYDEELPKPIDLWYEKHFYGKINNDGVPIHPLESKMKRFDSSDEDIFALDFVVDAFEDFRKHYLFLQNQNAQDTVFEFLKPVRGWNNPVERRESYIDQIYDMFVGSYLQNNKKHEKIISFKTFLKEFLNFMDVTAAEFPITLTNYLLSSWSNMHISGLMVSIDFQNHGNDLTKYEDFLQNVCFPCYTEAAQKFGFKIDKNAPWRLVADLKSPALQCYMGTNNSFDNIFDISYEKSYFSDPFLIKELCMRFYYSYISDFPFYTKYSYSPKCQETKSEIIIREQISQNKVDRDFPPPFWMVYYVDILLREKKHEMSKSQIRLLKSRAASMAHRRSFVSATEYVFQNFKESLLT